MKNLCFILSFFILVACQKESDNKKQEWSDVSVESATDFKDIQMLSENVGYVAGYIYGPAYSTLCTDIQPGDTSYISLDNTQPLLSYSFVDTENSTSIMFKTLDGGKTWNPVPLPFSKYNHMSFVDENTGFVLSGDGLYRTLNGGISWQKIMENKVVYENNTITNIFDKIKFISPNNGFLYTNNFMGGCILVSVNGNGELKKIISNRIEPTTTIPFINGIENIPDHPEDVVILTLKNIYKYNGSGEELELLYNDSFENLTYVCSSTWYASVSGILSMSNDAGISWNKISMLPISHCSILTSVGENKVCVSDKLGIYISDGGGHNFRPMSKPNIEITNICFPSLHTGLAVGPNGRILRYLKE